MNLRALHVQDGQVFCTMGSPNAHVTLVRLGPDDAGIGGEPWVGAQDPTGRHVALASRHGVRIIDQETGSFIDLGWPYEPAPPLAVLPWSDGRRVLVVAVDGVWYLDKNGGSPIVVGERPAAALQGDVAWVAAGGVIRQWQGTARWEAPWSGHALAAGDEGVVIAGERTLLLSMNSEHPAALDVGPTRTATWHGGPILGAHDGTLTLCGSDGVVRATTNLGSAITGLAADDDHIYAGLSDARLFALRRSDLSASWGWTVPSDGRPVPLTV